MTRTDVIIGRLMASHPKGYDLTLGRIGRLLGALGNPHLSLPPVVHVAGTNGKGSTIAFMRAMLEAAGVAVHSHTSPHLVSYTERYRIASGPGTSRFVDDERFAAALERVEAANGGGDITVFEVLTAAGFLMFSEAPADVVLLEVGLGGRFDATNVVPAPLVTAITSISIDHEAFLGDKIEAIAMEKAGIMKPGHPCVLAPQTDTVRGVIESEAARIGVPVLVAGQDWMAHEEHGRLLYQDGAGLLDLPLPRLAGRHQIDNAGTAIATLRACGLLADPQAVEKGLIGADWPGRLQRITSGPLAEAAVEGAELWLDGGHNPGAGEVVASAMADLEERLERPLLLIVGMLSTKDPAGFFRSFEGLARRVLTVPIDQSEAGRDPEELAGFARSAGLDADAAPGLVDAVRILSFGWEDEPAPRILICGSLYLAGQALALSDLAPS